MKNLIMYKKGQNSYARWVIKRVWNNLNFICVTYGATGSGKSLADICFAVKIDPDFSIEQVCFSFREVMNVINSDWFKKKKIKIIIFDEVQVDVNARTWQSLINKLFNYLLSTFRHKNIIFLMNSPYADFIDSASMKLVHCVFEVKGHSEKTKKVLIKPRLLQYNPEMKKFYNHSLMVLRDGMVHKLKKFYLPLPPKHLIKAYEKKKIEFTDSLNKKIMNQLENLDKKESSKEELSISPFQKEVLRLFLEGKKQREIAKVLNKYPQQVHDTIQTLKKKGILPEENSNFPKKISKINK